MTTEDVYGRITGRLADLPRKEILSALSHLLASGEILMTNQASLSEKDFARLAMKLFDAGARLGESEEFGDSETRQSYLADALAGDIDATVNPPEHDFDFGDLSASTKCHQLAIEICRELQEEEV